MKNFIKNEKKKINILRKIEIHEPVIKIDREDLDKYDPLSVWLFFSNRGSLTFESFLAKVRNEINKKGFRYFKNALFSIFISPDIEKRLRVKDLQNMISEFPEDINVCYGVYTMPETFNKMEIICIGKG